MSTLPPLSQLFAPPDRNVPTMLARQAAQYGDRPLLVFGDWLPKRSVEAALANRELLAATA